MDVRVIRLEKRQDWLTALYVSVQKWLGGSGLEGLAGLAGLIGWVDPMGIGRCGRIDG